MHGRTAAYEEEGKMAEHPDLSLAPIPFEQLARRVRARQRRRVPPAETLTQTLIMPGRKPTVRVQRTQALRDAVAAEKVPVYRVELKLARRQVGVHAFAPGVRGTMLSGRRKRLGEADNARSLHGYLPDHLDLRPLPRKLERRFVLPRRFDALAKPEARQATTVFTPDERYTFNDTASPWCTVGRVDTAGGWATGGMIGPRHILTCSHAIQWNANPNPYVAG
jgi:hypothetical protein